MFFPVITKKFKIKGLKFCKVANLQKVGNLEARKKFFRRNEN
jgi:hypothetical protein